MKASPPSRLLPFPLIRADLACVLSVFNYWDPLHYLVHGKGFQTWEYSPEFSIRSYFYLLIHAGPAYTLKLLGFEDKVSLVIDSIGGTEF